MKTILLLNTCFEKTLSSQVLREIAKFEASGLIVILVNKNAISSLFHGVTVEDLSHIITYLIDILHEISEEAGATE